MKGASEAGEWAPGPAGQGGGIKLGIWMGLRSSKIIRVDRLRVIQVTLFCKRIVN